MFRFVVVSSAFLLSLFVTISLPNFGTLDVGRVVFKNGNNGVAGTKTIRFGAWSFCADLNSTIANPCDAISPCNSTAMQDLRYCTPQHYAYSFTLLPIESSTTPSPAINITPGWTRSLAIHPAFTILLFIAMLCSGTRYFASFCAAVLGFITLMVDVAFLQHVQSSMKKVGIAHSVNTGAGSILTMVSFILAFIYLISTPQYESRYGSTDRSKAKSKLWSLLSKFTTRSRKSKRAGTKSYLPTSSPTHPSIHLAPYRDSADNTTSIDASRTQTQSNRLQALFSQNTSRPSSSITRVDSTTSLPLCMPGSYNDSASTLKIPEPAQASPSRRSSVSTFTSTVSASTMTCGAGGHKCPLCFEKRTELSSSPCGHVFCTRCIETALERDPRCPMCRRETRKEELRTVYLTV